MRRIGRLRSEASPSKVAMIGWPPTTPIISREPVPALPKSSVSRGASSAPSPGPRTLHAPARALDDGAERPARLAGAQHVVALEQPLDLVVAAGQQSEQEGAMRNRLVAGRANAALAAAARARVNGRAGGGCDDGRTSELLPSREGEWPRAGGGRAPNIDKRACRPRESLLTRRRARLTGASRSRHRSGNNRRGQTRARSQAPMPVLRRQVL